MLFACFFPKKVVPLQGKTLKPIQITMNNKNEQIVTLVKNKLIALRNLADQLPLSERFSPSNEVTFLDALVTSFIAYIYTYIAAEQADKRVLDILSLDFYDKIDPNHIVLDEESLQIFAQDGALTIDTLLDVVITGSGMHSKFWMATPNIPIDFLLNKYQQPLDEIYMCGEPFLTSCIQSKGASWIVDEIDGVIWAIDVVRGYLHDWKATINHKEITIAQQYNKIVCFHPYNPNKEQSIKFLNTVYGKLKVGGELVMVTHPAVIFGYQYKDIRKQWLENGAIRDVYDLGTGWVNLSGVAFVVIVLQKQDSKKSFFSSSPRNREVRFVDLVAYAKTNNVTNQEMRNLLCKPNLKTYEESVSVTCTNEELLMDEMLNLSPSRMVEQAKSKNISNAVKLADIVAEDKIKTITQNTYLDLTTEFIAQNINSSFELDLSTCPIRKSLKDQPVQFIDCDAVIVHSSSRKQKPFIYRHKGNEPIVLTRSWVVLRLQENSDTTLDYLVTEMSMDYFYDQVRAMDSRSIITRLSRREWLQLYIVLPPSKAEQEARLRENRDKMTMGILENQSAMLKDLLKLEKEKYIKAVRTRKHNMGNLLLEIVPLFEILSKALEKDAYLSNYIISARKQKTLKDYLDNIKTNIDKLSKMVKHIVDDIEVSDYSLETVNIIDYINNWLKERPLTEKFTVESYNRLGVDEVEVEISTHFSELLDNIFTNAIKHGFSDVTRNNYAIRIVLDATDNGDLSIKIANNGNGLTKGMTEKTVFDYGQSSSNGDGIGCWNVREIVKQSHGSVNFHYNPLAGDGFMIEYDIILPTV